MNVLKKISQKLLAVLVLASAVSSANAAIISRTFNANGYDVLAFNVASDLTVDFQFRDGWGDAMMSLFDSTGKHLISNDDADGSLNPHLTRSLAAGSYSLLVSYCCGIANALSDATVTYTDGFNSGRYWLGGTATIDDVRNHLNEFDMAAFASYELNMKNAQIGAVPEPQSVALFGVALGTLALARRRKRQSA